MNRYERFIDAIEFYPNQLDLNKNVLRYYNETQLNADFFSIYQDLYIDSQVFSKSDFMQCVQNILCTQLLDQQKAMAMKLSECSEKFQMNILLSFKIYLMLQEYRKINRAFKTEQDEQIYVHLDHFFETLKIEPSPIDTRQNKREIVLPQTNAAPIIFICIASLSALGLMFFTSGILSSIIQACLYGGVFISARAASSGGKKREGTSMNHYLIQMDCFLETIHNSNNQKVNPALTTSSSP